MVKEIPGKLEFCEKAGIAFVKINQDCTELQLRAVIRSDHREHGISEYKARN